MLPRTFVVLFAISCIYLYQGCSSSRYIPTPGCTGNKYEEAYEYVLVSSEVDSLVERYIGRKYIPEIRVSSEPANLLYSWFKGDFENTERLLSDIPEADTASAPSGYGDMWIIDKYRSVGSGNKKLKNIGTKINKGVALLLSTPLSNTLRGTIMFIEEGKGVSDSYRQSVTIELLYTYDDRGCIDSVFSKEVHHD